MIINVASFGGRSHLLDIARELEKHGHTVRFYSYVPKKRAVNFGLKEENSFSIFFWVLPFLFLFKIFGFKEWTQQVYWRFVDFFLAYYMKPCDVFIGQSPMHLYSLKYMKRKFGATTILERGTSHVNEFIKHVENNPKFHNKKVFRESSVKRDLIGYNFADYISVGSEHVKDSFIMNGFDASKIFVNNYGFDVNQFHPTKLNKEDSEIFDLIFVGQWSYRKGCDLIEEVCRENKYRFLHVGAIQDLKFPQDVPNMIHFDAVDQKDLINFYAKSRVFIILSREEGLALVQAQALACGLPIICSEFTGGRDLREYSEKPTYIIEVDIFSKKSINDGIVKALGISEVQVGERNYIGSNFNEITWTGYGNRYNKFLKKLSVQLND